MIGSVWTLGLSLWSYVVPTPGLERVNNIGVPFGFSFQCLF